MKIESINVKGRGGLSMQYSVNDEVIYLNVIMKNSSVVHLEFEREQFNEFVDFLRHIDQGE